MDRHDALWFAGFLLRRITDGSLAGSSHGRSSVPSCFDPRLRKTILLRCLSSDLHSGSLSIDTLQALEVLEEVDRVLGAGQTSEPLKAAYSAVAAELTAAPLRSGDRADFFEAVNRIWNCRVGDLERSEARGMMGEELREWRRLMEEAVVSDAARDAVLRRDTRGEALKALKEYLTVYPKEQGISLLDPTVRAVGGKSGIEGTRRKERPRESSRTPGASEETGDDTESPPMEPFSPDCSARTTVVGGSSFIPETERQKRGAMSGQTDTPEKDSSLKELNCLSSSGIDEAQKTLKLTLAELQNAVEDPLRNALSKAREVQSSVEVMLANHQVANKGQDQIDVFVPGPSVQMGSQATVTERAAVQVPNGISCATELRTIVGRNPSSCTCEWDEDSNEGTSDSRASFRKEHLPTPSNHRVSVLQTREPTTFNRRRKARRWSPREEDALREAVKVYGRGNWKLILLHSRGTFGDRTEVDLKDKWRNMTR